MSAPLASSAELIAYSAVLLQSLHTALFVDWSNHTEDADAFYFSFQGNAYIQIVSDALPDTTTLPTTNQCVEGSRAITENVHKTFPQALVTFSQPARLEFETILTSTKSLVRMETALARQHIQQGA